MPDNNPSLSGLGQELLNRRWLMMALLVGFDYHGTNGYQKAGHFGLEIMRERAEELSGKLATQSAEGASALVMLWLPLIIDLKKGQYT